MGVINLGALVEKLRKKLSGDFISKTDYPSGDNAGVIKVDSTYATEVTSGGKLKAKAITAASYDEANDGAFISKATLDNLKTAGKLGGLTQLYAAPETPETITNDAEFTLTDNPINYKELLIVMLSGSNPVTVSGIPVQGISDYYFTGVYYDSNVGVKVNCANFGFTDQNKFKRTYVFVTSQTVCKLLAIYGIK